MTAKRRRFSLVLDFSIRKTPASPEELDFDTVFYVYADHTHVVPRKAYTPGKTHLLVTLRGEGVVTCNGRTYDVGPNTLLYLQPQADFTYRCKEDLWEHWWFEYFGAAPCKSGVLHTMEMDFFYRELMRKILSFAKENSWSIASQLLASLNTLIGHQLSHSSTMTPGDQLMSSMEAYIRESQGLVTVQDLAKAFSVEERTLRNFFHSHTGLSPKQAITKIRMTHASHLLLTTEASLEEIAQQLGYSSQYHFSRAFKDFYGVTPMRYRKYAQ